MTDLTFNESSRLITVSLDTHERVPFVDMLLDRVACPRESRHLSLLAEFVGDIAGCENRDQEAYGEWSQLAALCLHKLLEIEEATR